MRTFKTFGKRCTRGILLASTLMLLLSTTGCSRSYVTIPGGETVIVQKQTIDRLYSDNERLIQALQECQEGR